MLTWLKNVWTGFEAWVAKWLPGFKTVLVATLGAIGNAAFLMQGWIGGLTGLPSNVVSGSQIAVASAILFTLAFWLRGLGDRVETRATGLTQLP